MTPELSAALRTWRLLVRDVNDPQRSCEVMLDILDRNLTVKLSRSNGKISAWDLGKRTLGVYSSLTDNVILHAASGSGLAGVSLPAEDEDAGEDILRRELTRCGWNVLPTEKDDDE